MIRFKPNTALILSAVLLIIVLSIFAVSRPFALNLLIIMAIYAVLSLGLNLISGYTGMLSLCHAAFFAIGAYTTAIAVSKFSMNYWLALALSGLLAAICGILIGIPTLRLKGDYLAIATLGFGEIVKNVILNADDLTRGPMGIHGIPSVNILGLTLSSNFKITSLIITLVFLGGSYLFVRRIIRSRFGRALEAIREDDIAAQSMGINVTKYKVASFAIGAFLAGLAGNLYAVYLQSITPENFNFLTSVMILCMVVLGGMGNNLAVVLGSVIILLSQEMPRLLNLQFMTPEVRQIIFGLILVCMMIFRPQGILKRKKPNFEHLIKKPGKSSKGSL